MGSLSYSGVRGQTACAGFNDALAASESPHARRLFDAAYARHIADRGATLVDITRPLSVHSADQAAGHDAALTMETRTGSRHVIYAEEKVRPQRAPTDILLEIEHEYRDGRVRPGWACVYGDDVDILAYAFPKHGTVVLIKWPDLRGALSLALRDWEADYSLPPLHAQTTTGGFVTHNIAVPLEELYCAAVRYTVYRDLEEASHGR